LTNAKGTGKFSDQIRGDGDTYVVSKRGNGTTAELLDVYETYTKKKKDICRGGNVLVEHTSKETKGNGEGLGMRFKREIKRWGRFAEKPHAFPGDWEEKN